MELYLRMQKYAIEIGHHPLWKGTIFRILKYLTVCDSANYHLNHFVSFCILEL